jgi:hypothetical protein
METSGKDKSFIHCEFFNEAMALTPNRVVTIQDKDGFGYYVLGEAKQQRDGWIVPLKLVDDAAAQGLLPLRQIVVREDGKVA